LAVLQSLLEQLDSAYLAAVGSASGKPSASKTSEAVDGVQPAAAYTAPDDASNSSNPAVRDALDNLVALCDLRADSSVLLQAAVSELSSHSAGRLARRCPPEQLAAAAASIAAAGNHHLTAPLIDKLCIALAEQASNSSVASGLRQGALTPAPTPSQLVAALAASTRLGRPCGLLQQVVMRQLHDAPAAFGPEEVERVLWCAREADGRNPRMLEAAGDAILEHCSAAEPQQQRQQQQRADELVTATISHDLAARLLQLYADLVYLHRPVFSRLCDLLASLQPLGDPGRKLKTGGQGVGAAVNEQAVKGQGAVAGNLPEAGLPAASRCQLLGSQVSALEACSRVSFQHAQLQQVVSSCLANRLRQEQQVLYSTVLYTCVDMSASLFTNIPLSAQHRGCTLCSNTVVCMSAVCMNSMC
jgi:hypothetical protein